MIYLDNASTTMMDPHVLTAMLPYLTSEYGNPGGLYQMGFSAKEAIQKAREQVAAFIGAKPEQIIFTGSGSEANNMVFVSLLPWMWRDGETPHVIVGANEHDSVLQTVGALREQGRITLTLVSPNRSGFIEPHVFEDAFTDQTKLASVMCVNNETGAESDVREIAQLCREHDILFHTDCVQAAGSRVLDVRKLGCDFLTLSAHKLYGPKGIGALFARDRSVLVPYTHGGSNQEYGLRGGTENVPGIVGFGAACARLTDEIHELSVYNSVLKQRFLSKLQEYLAKLHIASILHVNGASVMKPGKILNLRFDGIDGETLILMLGARGVMVSAGSACTSHSSDPSHVLLSMGITPEEARSSIRVSFSKMNTEEEAVAAAKIVADCVWKLLHGD